MPLGYGAWYNRRTRKYLIIDDHANDAAANPKRFGLTDKDLITAVGIDGREHTTSKGHVVVKNQTDRELVIIRVAQAGFIRVRYHKGYLGWQFAGDPENALSVLRNFIKRWQVGTVVLVTFTDFGQGVSLTERSVLFDSLFENSPVNRLIERWRSRYEISQSLLHPEKLV